MQMPILRRGEGEPLAAHVLRPEGALHLAGDWDGGALPALQPCKTPLTLGESEDTAAGTVLLEPVKVLELVVIRVSWKIPRSQRGCPLGSSRESASRFDFGPMGTCFLLN